MGNSLYCLHNEILSTISSAPAKQSSLSISATGGKSSNPFYCRNCDRDLFSDDVFRAHVAEHETCGVDGCPYTAHPKLVLNHYKTQHVTGLAGKVWKVQTPEDIAKWREDRKRNFPTVARVAVIKREARERKKKGNVLNNQYFGKIHGDARANARGKFRTNR